MSAAGARVAVVGTGISGAFCAHALRAGGGVQVTLFDKAIKGPGGRASTRDHNGRQFDHGCAFIAPVQDRRVAAIVHDLREAGVLRTWDTTVGLYDASSRTLRQRGGDGDTGASPRFCGLGKEGPLLCGHPRMDSVVARLASASTSSQPVPQWGTHVTTFSHDPSSNTWSLRGRRGSSMAAPEQDLGRFDALVLGNPAATASSDAHGQSLQAEGIDIFSQALRRVTFKPAFSLLAEFPKQLGLEHGLYSIAGHRYFELLSRDSCKPGRTVNGEAERWVAITTERFALELLQQSKVYRDTGAFEAFRGEYKAMVTDEMLSALTDLLTDLGAKSVCTAAWYGSQRWGKAFVAQPLGEGAVSSPAHRIAACGDFCLGSNFESAAISGLSASDSVREFMDL